jgi:hypothetical protein
MIDSDPFRTARRNLRRRARFGQNPEACIRCGYLDLVALIPGTREQLEAQRVPRTLFEGDHIVGEAHDPTFVFSICRNCHALVTDERLRAGISMLPEPDQNERAALRMDALALFEETVAKALRSWAGEVAASPTTKREALNLEALASLYEKSAIDLHRWAIEKRVKSGDPNG